jgi:methionine synthase II (cobalamin-independent)
MKVSKRRVMAGLAVIPTGLVVGTNRIACAQPQGDVIGELASNEGIFVDGKTFKIAKGGCIVTQSPRPESAEEVCDQLVAAANFIDKQRLGSTDDCGFSPFSIDKKPNHGSPDYARDVAFQKIANRVAGTKMAAEKLGVH